MLGDVKSNRSKIFNDGISYMQMKFNERGQKDAGYLLRQL